MKEKTLSIFEAQKEILNFPKQLIAGKSHIIAATCDGKPALAILPSCLLSKSKKVVSPQSRYVPSAHMH